MPNPSKLEHSMGNTELRLSLSAIGDEIREVKQIATETRIQTVKTNGRVSKLERWQSYVIGFCACVVLIMLPTVLLLVQILFKLHA